MNIKEIEIINPWWKEAKLIERDHHLASIKDKPYYFDNPIKNKINLDRGRTYVLRGARQIGKTTLLKELIAKVIKTKTIKAKNCLFISCEAYNDYKQLQKILLWWIEPRKDKKTIICLDEISFIEQWQRALLWLINAGLLQNATVLISGSNAKDLKSSSERFPGRQVKEINLYPLSPLDYKKVPYLSTVEPKKLLDIYFNIGGFPHAIKDYYNLQSVSDDTYETYANWIFGDAHRFGLNREILLHILFRIYNTVASQMTYQRLIEKSPVKSHETAANYVEHLETSFLCSVLNCYDPAKDMAAPRKAKKMYFIDPLLYGISGALLQGIRNVSSWWSKKLQDSELKGKFFEAIAANALIRHNKQVYFYYSANTKKEVDIVLRKEDGLELYDIKNHKQPVKPVLGKKVKLITPQNIFSYLK